MKETSNNFIRMLRSDENNLSFWYPKIKDCGIRTPRTLIIKVPDNIVASLFLENKDDRKRIEKFVKATVVPKAQEMTDLCGGSLPFLKNGCFSNKFTFNLCAPENLDPETITNSFIGINYDALCVDAFGCTEFIIRERIPQPNGMPTIYNGMPLNTEFRIFYDFNKKKVIYAVNYWDKTYCQEKICRNPHDAQQYLDNYHALEQRYEKNVLQAIRLCEERLKKVTALKGIWSVDLLLDTDGTFWLIDMAVGHKSFYWDPAKITLFYMWETFTDCMYLLNEQKTNSVLLSAGIAGKRTNTQTVNNEWNDLLLPLFSELTGIRTDKDSRHRFLMENLPEKEKDFCLKHYEIISRNPQYLDLSTMHAVQAWCERLISKNNPQTR